MSLLCAIGIHRWKPVVRGSLSRKGSMDAYDFMVGLWSSPMVAGIMAQHYLDALWRGFHKRGECCTRCKRRR